MDRKPHRVERVENHVIKRYNQAEEDQPYELVSNKD